MTTMGDRAKAACIDEEYCVPYSDADMRRDLEQLVRYARAKGPGGAVDMVMSQSEHVIKRVTGDRIASTQALREAAERLCVATPGDWRMSAYYYDFEPTGIAAIDRILSAVACAGKAHHNTDGWTDDDWDEPYHNGLRGESPVEWIQNAANDAAAALRTALATLETKS